MNEGTDKNIKNPGKKSQGFFDNIAFGIRVYNILSVAVVFGFGTGLYWAGSIAQSVNKNTGDIKELVVAVNKIAITVEVMSKSDSLINVSNILLVNTLRAEFKDLKKSFQTVAEDVKGIKQQEIFENGYRSGKNSLRSKKTNKKNDHEFQNYAIK